MRKRKIQLANIGHTSQKLLVWLILASMLLQATAASVYAEDIAGLTTLTASPDAKKSLGFLEPITNGLANGLSRVITLNNTVKLKNPRKEFQMSEVPTFTLAIPKKTQEEIGTQTTNAWHTKDESIQAHLVYKADNSIIPAIIKKTNAGTFEVKVDTNKAGFKRGTYHLALEAKESFLYTRNLEQDFSWGVLAINTNKSIYTPSETAQIAMGVVSPYGDAVCNAKVWLTIVDPDKKETRVTTEDGTVIISPDCGSYKPTPDYASAYTTGKEGRYFIHLSAETAFGRHEITDYFEVKQALPFEIERINFPTRVYPAAAYPVTIRIQANQDYAGPVSEYVTSSMAITDISDGGTLAETTTFPLLDQPAEVIEQDRKAYGHIPKRSTLLYADKNNKAFSDKTPIALTWQVQWQKGQTYQLSYTVNFAPISPEFYLIGPLQIQEFKEVRQWQFGIDATECWAGTVDVNWSTANNWVTTAGASATLGSADVAVFDSSATTCTSGTTNNNATLDAGFGGSVQAVRILTYTGTITQNRALTITTGGVNVGFTQTATGSTWTGNGAYDITMTTVATSDFNHTAGTFTAPSGTITVADNFTSSAGTFTATTGTVVLKAEDNANTTTGSVTFNNLQFIEGATPDNKRTWTIASGTTLTVNGTLTLQGDGCCRDSDSNNEAINNTSGGISAKGDITVVNQGIFGTVTITVNGTGTQTITGENDNDNLVPSLTIDKSSGTLYFSSSITPSNNWTYTQGTVDFSTNTSTIVFASIQDNAGTITGSNTFYNIKFTDIGQTDNGRTTTISTGTTVTVANTLTLSGAGGGNETITASGTGNIVAQGDITTSTNGMTGTVPINITGSTATQTLTISGTSFPTGTLTVNKSSGTAQLATNFPMNSGQALNISGGTFNLAGFNLTGSPDITTSSTGTFKLQGAETVTATKTFTGGTVEFAGIDNDIQATYTVNTLSTSYYNLTINNAEASLNYDIFQLTATVDIDGAFTLTRGDFRPGANTMTVAGNFSNSNGTGATFTTGTSTVTFDGTATSVISGSTTFNILTCITSSKPLTFTASTTQTVATLTLTGSLGAPIIIRSSVTGTRANINVTGTSSVSRVDVKDNDATGATITATNSQNSGNNNNWLFTGSFSYDTSGAAWYDSKWSKRRKVAISEVNVPSTLTDFPVLVSFTALAMASIAQTDGDDFLFTSANGTTKLSHEIEKYDSSTGELIAWVKVPSLSGTVDTSLHLYYGNASAANQQDATNVWDSNYKLVNHMKESSGTTLADSTAGANNGTKVSATEPLPITAGQVNGAQDFDGTNDQAIIANESNFDITGSITVSAWYKATAAEVDPFDYMVAKPHDNDWGLYWLSFEDTEQLNAGIRYGTGCCAVTEVSRSANLGTSWNYAVLTFDTTTVRLYLNGSTSPTTATAGGATILTNNQSVQLGRYDAGLGLYYGGNLDEVRISNTNRSADWIQTEYNNISSPSSFAVVGPEQAHIMRVQGGVKFQGGAKLKSN